MVQGVVIEDGCIVNTNPATGEVIGRVRCSTTDQVDSMVQAAKAAQLEWFDGTSSGERVALLKKALEAVGKRSEDYVRKIVEEMGKPIGEAKEEMEGAVDKGDFMDVLEKSLQPQTFGNSIVVRHALGVVAILSPWNYPVDEILLLALPALASGNTVIVKPSEVVPETGAMLVEDMQSVLPANVIQVAQGDGTVGAFLVNHKDVSMVAMTGSSATGKKILSDTASSAKRVVLEMGGKDPMIVFEDADLTKAAKDAVAYSLSNTGQVCCSIERIYVAETVYDRFKGMVKEESSVYKVGNGIDPNVRVGPLVSALQRRVVEEQVEDAVKRGATLLYKSDVPVDVGGHFFPVTVLADATHGMRVFTEETFGPIVALAKFDGEESTAVDLANDTEYGLGSSVYTSDKKKGRRVANRIHAGQVGINCYPIDNMNVNCPWVGHKQSGYGYHSGVDGFHQFSIPKSVVYDEDTDE